MNPLQGSPVELKTRTEGICAVFMPNSAQPLGYFGSHVVTKCAQWKQLIFSFSGDIINLF